MFIGPFLNLLFIFCAYSEWKLSELSMPASTSYAAIAYHKHTIFIIGGDYGLMSYDIQNNTYSYNQTFLTRPISSHAQSWIQINDLLYVTTLYNGYLDVFDLNTKQFITRWSNISVSNLKGESVCLAASNDGLFLYYVGGEASSKQFASVNSFRILNLVNRSWFRGPNMNTQRSYHSCIVAPNGNLYAIGGCLHYSQYGCFVATKPHFDGPIL